MLPSDFRIYEEPSFILNNNMKRYYDTFIHFSIDTESKTFELTFASDWKFTEMLDYMCDSFAIDRDSIVEIRQTYIKRYKLSHDA